MAKRENFNDLIASIQEAFLQVNKMSELQHLDMLKNYFNSENKPICIDMQYPHISESGEVLYRKVSVPKLCLVPISSLKLNEVLVDFKVKLYGKIELKEGDRKNNENGMLKAANSNTETAKTYLGYAPGGFGFRSENSDSYANISLKFTSEEPPEGLMRISDELIKVMI